MAPRLALFGLLTTVLAVTIQAGAGRILGPDASQAKSSVLHQKMKNLTPELRSSSDTTTAIGDQETAKANRTHDLRAAGCTSDYEFTYVPERTTLNIQNHLKRFTKEKKTICGWWFWTVAGPELVLECTYIDLRDEDFMVIYDVDNEENHGIDGPAVESNYTIEFNSVNVVIGLETTLAREERTFECTISSLYVSHYVLIGGTDMDDNSVAAYSSISGSLFPTLPLVGGNPFGSILAMNDGILYVCGGTEGTEDSNAIKSIDLTLENADYVALGTVDHMQTSHTAAAFAMPNSLWILAGREIIEVIVPANGTANIVSTGVFTDSPGCGAGDDQYRFVWIRNSDKVLFNDDAADKTAWAPATIGEVLMNPCCYYHDENFYVAGGSSKKAYKVNIDLTVTELPDLNSAAIGCAMGFIDNKVAVIGGKNALSGATADAQVYDSALDEWTTVSGVLDMPTLNIGYLRTSLRF